MKLFRSIKTSFSQTPLHSDRFKMRIRYVGFILLGALVLMFKSHYSGPLIRLVHSYAGNIVVSFAFYFYIGLIMIFAPIKEKHRRLFTTVIALIGVELFEVFDGFGIMSNVYDDLDLVANTVGVVIAFATDTALVLSIRSSKV